MDINWGGQALFKLKGKKASILIDPFKEEFTGLKLPKDLSSDVVLSSHNHDDHNNTSGINSPAGSPAMIFKDPGEYEVAGVVISAIPSFHDNTSGSERGKNTIFHLMFDGLNIVHLGDLGQQELTEEQIAQIGEVDILLIPVGGTYTIDGKQATVIISQLEPKIIIPMHYKLPGLKFDLAELEVFLKEMGAEGTTAQPRLSITKDKLPEEPMVVVLSKT